MKKQDCSKERLDAAAEAAKKENLVGNIYGSRVSKNGKWLNLIIAFKMNGEEKKITCPVKIDETEDKPFAIIKEINEDGLKRAVICGVKVYEDRKEPPKQEDAISDDLPF